MFALFMIAILILIPCISWSLIYLVDKFLDANSFIGGFIIISISVFSFFLEIGLTLVSLQMFLEWVSLTLK